MNFLFAWRYFKAKKSTNAINIISWVSMIAIIVITAAFIVLLSVFNGFEGLVKSLYSSFYTDIRIGPKEGKRMIVSPDQLKRLTATEGVADYSMIVEDKTLIINGDIQTIVYLKGVDENYQKVSGVPDRMVRGNFELGSADQPAVVLGSGIENALGLQSDRSIYPVTAYLFKPGISVNAIDPLSAFAAENLVPSGTFFIQQEIDNKYAITNVAFMKRMLGMRDDEFGNIEIAIEESANPNRVKRLLEEIFGGSYLVETRYEQNRSLYSIMTLEKWAIYGILTLMLIVAAFTMVGALTMLVLEKQKDIQVLKSMGAQNSLIQKIFLSEGLLLAGVGTVCGVIIAILICWAQVEFQLIAIQGGTFLINYYPVVLKPADFVLVVLTVMLIALLASWFPARKAALQPVQLKS